AGAHAWGFAGLLRARDFWAARGRNPFPAEEADAVRAAHVFMDRAHAAHQEARRLCRTLPPTLFPAYGYLAFVPLYLKSAKPPSRFKRQLTLLAASLSGRV
ncbi:MAG: hypothetical protein AB7L65_07910, partial [Hyphomonadaceae bacterium]